jgi:hypothetical protein
MAINTDILIPAYGTSPHPLTAETDLDCVLSFIGTADLNVWKNISFNSQLYPYRRTSGGDLVESYLTSGSSLNIGDLSSGSNIDLFPLTRTNAHIVNLSISSYVLPSNTGSRGFRVAFNSKSGKKVYPYPCGASKTTGSLIYQMGSGRRFAGFIKKDVDPATMNTSDIMLGSICLPSVNSERPVHYINGIEVDSSLTHFHIASGYELAANTAFDRDWTKAACYINFYGGTIRYFTEDVDLSDCDYVEYSSTNGGGANSSNTYSSSVYLVAISDYIIPTTNYLYKTMDDTQTITIPDPPNPVQPNPNLDAAPPNYPPSVPSKPPSTHPDNSEHGHTIILTNDRDGDGFDETVTICTNAGCKRYIRDQFGNVVEV